MTPSGSTACRLISASSSSSFPWDGCDGPVQYCHLTPNAWLVRLRKACQSTLEDYKCFYMRLHVQRNAVFLWERVCLRVGYTFSFEQPSPTIQSAGGPVWLLAPRVAGKAGPETRPLSSGPGGALPSVARAVAAVVVVVAVVLVFRG